MDKIEELEAEATVTKKKYVVPEKGNIRRLENPNGLKTPPRNGKLYKD